MALVAMEGFDNGRLPAGWGATGSNGSNQFPAGRVNGTAYKRATNPYGDVQTITYTPPNSLISMGLGFAVYLHDGGYGAVEPAIYAPGSAYKIIQLREGATTHLYLDRDSAGKIRVCRGDGTVLGTSSVVTNMWQVWNHIALDVTISPTTGKVRLKVNGSVVLNLTNVNTRNGGTSGVVDTFAWVTPNGYASVHLDDWYLCDSTGPAPYNTDLGDCKVETLRPSADGASSGWVGSDGNSLLNWQLVDDNSTTTDYVIADSVGDRDLYELTNVSGVALGDIYGVQVEVLEAKSDAGDPPGSLAVVMRSSGGVVTTDTVAVPAEIATTYQWKTSPVKTVDPNGDPWTVARIDGLQVGVEVVP